MYIYCTCYCIANTNYCSITINLNNIIFIIVKVKCSVSVIIDIKNNSYFITNFYICIIAPSSFELSLDIIQQSLTQPVPLFIK